MCGSPRYNSKLLLRISRTSSLTCYSPEILLYTMWTYEHLILLQSAMSINWAMYVKVSKWAINWSVLPPLLCVTVRENSPHSWSEKCKRWAANAVSQVGKMAGNRMTPAEKAHQGLVCHLSLYQLLSTERRPAFLVDSQCTNTNQWRHPAAPQHRTG